MRKLIQIGVTVLVAVLIGACGEDSDDAEVTDVSTSDIPAEPESGTVNMSLAPWIGYGPWYVAEQEGIFEDEGLDVEIISFVDANKEEASFAAGDVDVMNNVPNRILKIASAGVQVAIVLMLDTSSGADGIVAGSGIEAVPDLEGKRVGYDASGTAELLARAALDQNGMTVDDIEHVELDPAKALSALSSGSVDAVSTYEPYMTEATASGEDKVIFTSKEAPGVISDVLVARPDWLSENPGQMAALVRSWYSAVDFIEENPDEGLKIMSEALGASVEDLGPTFEGVDIFGAADNERLFIDGEITEQLQIVYDLSKEAGLVKGDVTIDDLVNPAFVENEAASSGN